jgi:two-component system, OmpR family, response regulator
VSSHTIRALYVDRDETLGRLVTSYLEGKNVDVHRLSSSDMAVTDIDRMRPEVVLLELVVPGLAGLDTCRQIRARFDVPIIIVSSLAGLEDRVLALEAGAADDYLTKPFEVRELLARVRAQARRYRGELLPRTGKLVVGPMVVDLSARTLTVRGTTVVLTTNEHAIVSALALQPGRVLTRVELLQVVHGNSDDAFDRAIDVLISRIRAKIEKDAKRPTLLRTVRGVGYVIAASDEAA